MKKKEYYIVLADVYVEKTGKYEKMAGYVPAVDEQEAYKVAKGLCMNKYNCQLHQVSIAAVSLANDQELATNIPISIDKRSYEEMDSGEGLFSVEADILDRISPRNDNNQIH